MFLHPVYLTLLIVGCVAIGVVCGPAIHTAFAEAKVKVENKYGAQIAKLQQDFTAVQMKAANDIAQVKLDAINDANKVKVDAEAAYASMKSRAESAESDLAALKRFLPGASATAAPTSTAVVAAPISFAPPAAVATTIAPAVPQPAQDNTGAAAMGAVGAFPSTT